MSMSFGAIKGQMILDVKQALSAYTAVRQEHISTVSALSTGGGAIATSGAMIAGAGVAMAAGLIAAVNASAEFERKLDYFVAVGGPQAAARYDEVSAKALQIGQDTIYSADQIADSFVELAKAGVGVEDLLAGIGEGVANLGAAADMPLVDAAMGLTTVLNTFGLEAKDAIRVTDILSGAANASTISVQDLILTLTYAGASAKTAGISFEDMSGAVALLGERGIRGSKAGTGLRQVFTKLLAPTKKGTAALEELGLMAEDGSSALRNMDGTLKPLPAVLDLFNQSLDGMTQAEKVNVLGRIFPITALPTILNLLDGGSEALGRLNDEINKTTAADVAAARLDNLSGDVEILRGNLETLAITAGGSFQNFSRQIVQGVTAVVQAFMDLDPAIQSAILVATAIAAVLAIIVGGLGILSGAVLNIIGLWLRMAPAMAALGGIFGKLIEHVRLLWMVFVPKWLGPVLGALALVTAALVYFFTQTETGQAVWGQIVSVITQAVNTILPIIQQLIANAGPMLQSAFEALIPVLAAVGSFFSSVLAPVLAIIVPAITQVGEAFAGVGSSASGMAGIAQIFNGILTAVVQSIPLIVNMVVQLILLVVTTIVNSAPQILTAGITLLNGLIQAFVTLLPTLITMVVNLIVMIITALVGALPMIVQAGLQLISGLIVGIAFALPLIIHAVLQLAVAIIGALLQAIPLLIDAALMLFMALVEALPVIVPLLIEGIVSLITGVVEALVAAVPLLLDAAIQLFMSLLEALIDIIPIVLVTVIELVPKVIVALLALIPILLDAAIKLFTSLVDALPRILPKLLSAVIGLIPKVIGALLGLIPTLLEAAFKLFMSIATAIPRVVPKVISALLSLGQQMIQGLVAGIAQMASAVMDAVSNVIGGAVNFAKSLLGIKSPSRVFMGIGSDTIAGLILGLDKERSALGREMTSIANDMTSFYDQVGAAAELDAMLRLSSTSATTLNSTPLEAQLAALSLQLQEIAEQDRINIEKLEVNNPEPEPTSESLPQSIRKTTYLVG